MRNGRHKVLTLGGERHLALRKAVNGNQAYRNHNQQNQAAKQNGQVCRSSDFAGVHLEHDFFVGRRQRALGPKLVFGVVLADSQEHCVFVHQFNRVRQLGVGELFFLSHVVQVDILVDDKALHNREHADINRTEEHDVVRRHANLEVRNVDVRVAAGENRNVGRNGRVVLGRFRHVGKRFFFRREFHAGGNLQVSNFVVQLVNRFGRVDRLHRALGKPVSNVEFYEQVLNQVAGLFTLFLVVEREVVPHGFTDAGTRVGVERRQKFAAMRNLEMPEQTLATLAEQRVEIAIRTARIREREEFREESAVTADHGNRVQNAVVLVGTAVFQIKVRREPEFETFVGGVDAFFNFLFFERRGLLVCLDEQDGQGNCNDQENGNKHQAFHDDCLVFLKIR